MLGAHRSLLRVVAGIVLVTVLIGLVPTRAFATADGEGLYQVVDQLGDTQAHWLVPPVLPPISHHARAAAHPLDTKGTGLEGPRTLPPIAFAPKRPPPGR